MQKGEQPGQDAADVANSATAADPEVDPTAAKAGADTAPKADNKKTDDPKSGDDPKGAPSRSWTGDDPKTDKDAEYPDPAYESGGPKGLEPTRYGDWERKGTISDF